MTPIQKAKARMLLNHVFFGTLLLNTPIKADPNCPTAYTNMTMIGYNPDFFAKLSVEEIEFVLAHEVLHIAFEHGLRRQSRNPLLWNIAADYAINLILREANFKLPDLPMCLDDKWAGMSAEQIYDALKKDAKKRPTMPEGGLGEDIKSPGPMGPAEQAQIQRGIQQKVAQAAQMARMAGNLSGSLERFVNEILNPTVPWQDLLREYMTRVTKDDEVWSRRNRRFRNVYLPARHTERMGEIIFIGDTSGSISAEELNKVAAEVNSVAEIMRPERIRVLWADTRVAKEEVFEIGDDIKLSPGGGGGTDMRVPLDYCERYDEAEVVVLCTDGYTPWCDVAPPYPLIIVCTTDVEIPAHMNAAVIRV